MNFFFHSLNSFVLKNCMHITGFLQSDALLQIYPSNACKLAREENFFDFYEESQPLQFHIGIQQMLT